MTPTRKLLAATILSTGLLTLGAVPGLAQSSSGSSGTGGTSETGAPPPGTDQTQEPGTTAAPGGEEPSADDAPADGTGAEEAPADDAETEEEPVEDTGGEEEPADDSSAEEEPAEDAGGEEAPADDAETDEAPTPTPAPEDDEEMEDAPADDDEAAAPADDAAMEAPQPTAEMQSVLDKMTELGAQPLGTIEVEEARSQPTPADAVMAVMEDEGIEPDPMLEAITTEDMMIPGAEGEVAARIYTPEGEGPFPVIVYYHGGGWVIADIDTYDSSARALAAGSEAIVVSVDYRQAPENMFPAAHEDAIAAYSWIVENAGDFNGDSSRIAVAGESAGANLAMNVAIAAREQELTEPVHQLLVYPVAGNDMTTESYMTNADAAPLSMEGMEWFVENVFENPMEESADPRINLVERDDLADLPPATIVLAEIDPLLTEGETLAENLEAAGVEVNQRTWDGVAHEFFGMGAVVPEAKEAVDFATADLQEALAAQ